MSYALRYTDKAAAQIDDLPDSFVEVVEQNLIRLAAAPVGLSVRVASPPFPPRGQLYHFRAADPDGANWFFTVIFRYSQDETTLHILSVTWRELIDE